MWASALAEGVTPARVCGNDMCATSCHLGVRLPGGILARGGITPVYKAFSGKDAKSAKNATSVSGRHFGGAGRHLAAWVAGKNPRLQGVFGVRPPDRQAATLRMWRPAPPAHSLNRQYATPVQGCHLAFLAGL